MFESNYAIEKIAFAYGSDRRAYVQAGSGNKRAVRRSLLLIVILLLISGCGILSQMEPVIDNSRLKDGVYQGYYKEGINSAFIEVSIQDRVIIDITVLEHSTSLENTSIAVIIGEILEKQSTDTNVVSGNFNSRSVIIKAVQKALEKACME